MKRALLFCGGVLLGLVAEAILWKGPSLYAYEEPWFSAPFTRIVGLGLFAEGVVAAAGAALCLARAFVPFTSVPAQTGTTVSGQTPEAIGGGPVLPICGMLFLLAAAGPFWQARDDLQHLEVMESLPDSLPANLSGVYRRSRQTALTFGVLYLVIGGGLLGAPLLLKSPVWQVGRRMNRSGCGIAIGGFLLSGVGVFLCLVNGLTLEGRSKDVSLVGHLGVLGGAVLAVVGSVVAVIARPSREALDQ